MLPVTPGRSTEEVRPRHASASLEERAKQSILAQEFLRDWARVKLGGPIGIAVWLSFAIFDHLSVQAMGIGRFDVLLGIRLVTAVVLAAMTAWMYSFRDPLRHVAMLEWGFVLSGVVLTTSVSLMCLVTGGFESLYAAGIMLSSFAMILVPRPFSKSAMWMTIVLLPYLVVLFGSTFFLPETRAQLASPRAMTFVGAFSFVGAADGLFIAVVSHVLFTMRRELMESRSVGRYRITRTLGRGGMGEVFAAYHHGLRRDVAIKVLRAPIEDEAAAKRFEREIHATSTLTHPNTVRLYDFGVSEDGRLFYAMELLEGETLKRRVARDGSLDESVAVHLVLQASEALAEAHGRGVVHRDVKPENLFVTKVGDDADFVKVLDFGIASVLDDPSFQVTRTGSIAGTPGTMSPEVIVGRPATPASDVYALGAVLYWLLTGSLPFGEEAGGATLVAHVHDPVVAPSARRGSPVSPALEALVLRCLAKSPLDRYADGRELARALRRIRVASHGAVRAPRLDVDRVRGAGVQAATPEDGSEVDDAETRELPRRDRSDLH